MVKKWFIFILLLIAGCNSAQPDSYPVPAPASEDTAPPALNEAYPAEESSEETGSDTAASESASPTIPQPTLTPPPPPEPEEPPAEAEAPAVDTAVEPSANQPGMGTVTIEAGDGLQIQATYAFPGGVAPYPGIILLHMLGSNRTIWEETGVMESLLLNGYAVLAVDMRGHGETGGEQDWELARDDMQRVWDYFVAQPETDETRTAVLGASIGANMSLITAVNHPAINTVILLSPGLDYRGVTTDDQIALYGDRPIFIVASNEDTYAAESSQQLHGLAQGEKQLQLYDGAGHGTTIFRNEPELINLILDWLREEVNGDQ